MSREELIEVIRRARFPVRPFGPVRGPVTTSPRVDPRSAAARSEAAKMAWAARRARAANIGREFQ